MMKKKEMRDLHLHLAKITPMRLEDGKGKYFLNPGEFQKSFTRALDHLCDWFSHRHPTIGVSIDIGNLTLDSGVTKEREYYQIVQIYPFESFKDILIDTNPDVLIGWLTAMSTNEYKMAKHFVRKITNSLDEWEEYVCPKDVLSLRLSFHG